MADDLTSSAIAEGYFYLQADARHQFTQILTRPFRNLPGIGLALLGMDPDSLRHLLIPVPPQTAGDLNEPALGALRCSLREVGADGHYLDLTCTEATLSSVFERLCADVIERLDSAASVHATVRATLDDWRALFLGGSAELGRESQIGLIGELEVLSDLSRCEPVAALESWVGASKALHDFAFGGAALEVKSTSSREGRRVTISSLEQLDPHSVNVLYLAAVHLRADGSAPTIDDRIRALIEAGVPSYKLIQKVAEYGHAFESGTNDNARFVLQDIRYWRVTDDFPGLRRSDLDERRLAGVERVKYDLSLDLAGDPLTAAEQEEMERNFVW